MQKYWFIYLKDGTKQKVEIEKYTREELEKAFGDSLDTLQDGYLSQEKTNSLLMWKVRMSYSNETENIWIEEDELLKAQYCMATGSSFFSKGGSVRGRDIISILPDYAYSNGYNRGYDPKPDEWNAIMQSKEYKYLLQKTQLSKQIASTGESLENCLELYKRETNLLLN